MNYDAKEAQHYATALEGFTAHYRGNPPWETGAPQPPFVAAAALVRGPLLDAGCGTGNASLFFAERGLDVTGIDFVEEAIRRARAKADARGLNVEFMVRDAMTFGEWDRRFASVVDSGLFHVYAGAPSAEKRGRYVRGLAHVLTPGGRLFLLSFTDAAAEGGVSRQELLDAFADGWDVESLELVRGEVNPAFAAEQPDAFQPGGPELWFAVIRRLAD